MTTVILLICLTLKFVLFLKNKIKFCHTFKLTFSSNCSKTGTSVPLIEIEPLLALHTTRDTPGVFPFFVVLQLEDPLLSVVQQKFLDSCDNFRDNYFSQST